MYFVCVYVSLIKRAYFWSSVFSAWIRYGVSCITCAPTCTWLYRRMIVVCSCEKFPVLCMEYYKLQGFLDYLIYNGNAFIVVFEAGGQVVDNWEYFHRNSIKQSPFAYLNTFCRVVIHERNFRTFWVNYFVAHHAGTGGLGPEVPSVRVRPTMF